MLPVALTKDLLKVLKRTYSGSKVGVDPSPGSVIFWVEISNLTQVEFTVTQEGGFKEHGEYSISHRITPMRTTSLTYDLAGKLGQELQKTALSTEKALGDFTKLVTEAGLRVLH